MTSAAIIVAPAYALAYTIFAAASTAEEKDLEVHERLGAEYCLYRARVTTQMDLSLSGPDACLKLITGMNMSEHKARFSQFRKQFTDASRKGNSRQLLMLALCVIQGVPQTVFLDINDDAVMIDAVLRQTGNKGTLLEALHATKAW